MSKCTKCGGNLAPSQKYCPECGAPAPIDLDVCQPAAQAATQPAIQTAPAQPASQKANPEKKTPFYKKKPFIIAAAVIVVLVLFGAIGGGGKSSTDNASSTSNTSASQTNTNTNSSSSNTSTNTTGNTSKTKKTLADTLAAYGTFEPVTVEGSGDDVIDIPCVGKPCIMTISHNGAHNFAVHTVSSSGSNVDLLVNEIGVFNGTVTDWSDYKSPTVLSVKADGNWSITFAPMANMQIAQNGESFAGPNVVGIDVDSISKVKFTHDGAHNFAVKGIGTNTSKLLVNEIGAYDGTVVWNQPQSFFIVEGDGNWTISW